MRAAAHLLPLALIACGSSDEELPPLTDATALSCPAPGDLPFRLESRDFEREGNAAFAAANPRIKDEASDVVGNPGGPLANVYLADDAVPSSAELSYRGLKARTTPTQGVFSKAVRNEPTSLWFFDSTAAAWTLLDRGVTDDFGGYAFAAGALVDPNDQPVYAVLEADGSCAVHNTFLLPPGTSFVVMDIDGTLTINDEELILQLTDESYVPKMMTAANTLAQTWAAKGYPIVYLTARGHTFEAESRAWLDLMGFPKGALITANGGPGADVYKTIWLERLIQVFGWVPVAAYGNARTDITAYANAGMALDRTFIIGPEAGTGGTVAIPDEDYTQHIAGFVAAQPDN
jgi:hypothetical protein